jgi:hypothetical protein
VRTHVLEHAFRHPAAAHVLVHEDVALVGEERRRPDAAAILVGPVRRDAIRRPVDHDRVRLRLILRRVDGREQSHAIAHRDVDLGFRVARLDGVQALRQERQARSRGDGEDEGDENAA